MAPIVARAPALLGEAYYPGQFLAGLAGAAMVLGKPAVALQLEALARDAGYRCGKLGTDRTSSNTYPVGSAAHVAFDKGWLDGQAAIAAEMGEGEVLADSSKKKPEVAGANAR